MRAPQKAEYFLERRELGIINVGETGTVTVDGKVYTIKHKEALYVGQGNKEVIFASESAKNPALFYINSTTAHKAYPNKKIGIEDVEVIELGAPETANARTLRKYIVNSVVDVCQLQMGMTVEERWKIGPRGSVVEGEEFTVVAGSEQQHTHWQKRNGLLRRRGA